MSHLRLPASPVLRCLLAFSLAICTLLPVGSITLLSKWMARKQELGPLIAGRVGSESELAEPPAREPHRQPSDRPHPASADPNPGFVSSHIAEVVASSQKRSAGSNLSELDRMSEKLNSVTSESSVDDLANSFQRWMGLESRATQTKADAVADFDIDSAQLHDIKRREAAAGQYEYTAVLIDARGSTLDLPMTESEGRETYALMQRIKANPLLEKIYRQIAMPLLDHLVRSARNRTEPEDVSR